MKNFLTFLLALICISSGVMAQPFEPKVVNPGPPGTLNNAIAEDTLPDGSRNPNRIYILKSGIPYLLSSAIESGPWPLRIAAEDGATKRPILVYATTGGTIDQLFRVSGEIWLQGLHLTTRDIVGNYYERLIRTIGEDARIIIDDCIIEDIDQAIVRVQSNDNKIYMTNNLISRIGQPFDPDNGRVIDNRGNPIDTLYMYNNLVYNVTSRYYRNSGAGSIKWGEIDQNTFVASGQRAFHFGPINHLRFTNNIVQDHGFIGIENIGPWGTPPFQMFIDTFDVNQIDWQVSHNFFNMRESVGSLLPVIDAGDDSLIIAPVFEDFMIQYLQNNNNYPTNIFEPEINYTNPAPPPADFIANEAAGTTEFSLPWDMTGITPDPIYSQLGGASAVSRYSTTHDYGYRTDHPAYTGGTQQQPIGCDFFDYIVNTKDVFADYQLTVFPNPVTDAIEMINLSGRALKQVNLFDLTGKNIFNFNELTDPYLRFDVATLNSGIYMLTVMNADGQVETKKIVKY
jgi:Secretion system C-terminal sorting domain